MLIFGRLSSDGRRLAQSAGEEFARKHTTPQSDSVALVNALITIVNGLKADTGRKTVLLFSEGFAVPPGYEHVFADLQSRANGADVSFYGVDDRGLQLATRSPAPVRPWPRRRRSALSSATRGAGAVRPHGSR